MAKYEDDLIAMSAQCKDADELVKMMRDVGSAADLATDVQGAKGAKGDAAAEDTAFDELIKKMQALGNAVDELAKGAKGEAIAAEAARDDAKRATSRALAGKAADEADKHKVKAEELKRWSSTVKDALAQVLQVIGNPTKNKNAGIVAKRAELGAEAVERYAKRAKQAATGAKGIANTA